MNNRRMNNTAFSLLEVLLASVIFIVSIGGIFATLNAVRTPVSNKENALAAAVFGKQILESLRTQVNAQTFYNACSVTNTDGTCQDFSLSLGAHEVPNANLPAGIVWPNTNLSNANIFNAVTEVSYVVTCGDGTTTSCVSGGTNPDMARRVDLNINW